MQCNFIVCVGVAKQRWQMKIIQDHIEEADEICEVELISPEATVLKGVRRAAITIRDSGSSKSNIVVYFYSYNSISAARISYWNMKTSGQCRLNQDSQAVLGGKEIGPDTYPQHGSIQLEKLPLGTGTVVWTRGDSISTSGDSLPKKKLRVLNNPKSVSLKVSPSKLIFSFHIFSKFAPSPLHQSSLFYFSGVPFISVSQWNRHHLHSKQPQHLNPALMVKNKLHCIGCSISVSWNYTNTRRG